MTHFPTSHSTFDSRAHAHKRAFGTPADPKVSLRTLDIASLALDDSVTHTQIRVPALPVFDHAFAAFAQGTVVQGMTLPISVEDLQPGDWLRTKDGTPAQVLWTASSLVGPNEISERMPLIRVMADSFGIGKPAAFVTAGPAARLFQTPHHLRAAHTGSALLTPLSAFVDGVNVIQTTPPAPVRLFHIGLDRHALIFVGGMLMESHHPDLPKVQALPGSLRSHYFSMFPHVSHAADFGPLTQTRAPEHTGHSTTG